MWRGGRNPSGPVCDRNSRPAVLFVPPEPAIFHFSFRKAGRDAATLTFPGAHRGPGGCHADDSVTRASSPCTWRRLFPSPAAKAAYETLVRVAPGHEAPPRSRQLSTCRQVSFGAAALRARSCPARVLRCGDLARQDGRPLGTREQRKGPSLPELNHLRDCKVWGGVRSLGRWPARPPHARRCPRSARG